MTATATSAPTKAKPGRPRSQASENAILSTTLELLAQKGYGGLTTDEIASRAKVSKSTIYRRWPSKQRLVIAAFLTTPVLVGSDTGDTVKDLQVILQQFIDIHNSTPLIGVLATLAGERIRDPELSDALQPIINDRRAPIRQVLENAKQRGEVDDAIDLELAVDFVMGPLLHQMFFTVTEIDTDKLKSMIDIAFQGIGPR